MCAPPTPLSTPSFLANALNLRPRPSPITTHHNEEISPEDQEATWVFQDIANGALEPDSEGDLMDRDWVELEQLGRRFDFQPLGWDEYQNADGLWIYARNMSEGERWEMEAEEEERREWGGFHKEVVAEMRRERREELRRRAGLFKRCSSYVLVLMGRLDMEQRIEAKYQEYLTIHRMMLGDDWINEIRGDTLTQTFENVQAKILEFIRMRRADDEDWWLEPSMRLVEHYTEHLRARNFQGKYDQWFQIMWRSRGCRTWELVERDAQRSFRKWQEFDRDFQRWRVRRAREVSGMLGQYKFCFGHPRIFSDRDGIEEDDFAFGDEEDLIAVYSAQERYERRVREYTRKMEPEPESCVAEARGDEEEERDGEIIVTEARGDNWDEEEEERDGEFLAAEARGDDWDKDERNREFFLALIRGDGEWDEREEQSNLYRAYSESVEANKSDSGWRAMGDS
ncbi:hypothetical protein ACLMJK_000563 [Lecanora helva]